MERLLDTSICWQPEVTVDAYCAQMKNDIVGILDDIAPIRTRSKFRPDAGHFLLSDEALEVKRMRRRLEARWDESGAEADRVAYRRACRDANALIVKSRTEHYAAKIVEASDQCSRRVDGNAEAGRDDGSQNDFGY